MIYWPAKAPGAVEDFEFDFSALLQTSETISTQVVTASGVNKDSSAPNAANTAVQVWLSAGALGVPGIVTCTITTSSGRTYVETAIVPIGEEPVSLDMAKRQCRAEATTTDDDYLLDLIQAAREYVEAYTGTRTVAAAVAMTFDSFESLDRLSGAPVQSVASVQYLDADGALQTLDASVYEFVNVDADQLRPRIRLAFNQKWPPARCAEDAVRVSAVVGYSVVPRPVIRAMLMLVSQWYDFRTPVQVDARGVPAEIPNAVTALLANFRR